MLRRRKGETSSSFNVARLFNSPPSRLPGFVGHGERFREHLGTDPTQSFKRRVSPNVRSDHSVFFTYRMPSSTGAFPLGRGNFTSVNPQASDHSRHPSVWLFTRNLHRSFAMTEAISPHAAVTIAPLIAASITIVFLHPWTPMFMRPWNSPSCDRTLRITRRSSGAGSVTLPGRPREPVTPYTRSRECTPSGSRVR